MDLLTIYLLFFTALIIFTILTTVCFYRWRMKEMRQANSHYKGCIQLYRQASKQDLTDEVDEVVIEFERQTKKLLDVINTFRSTTTNKNNKGESKWN